MDELQKLYDGWSEEHSPGPEVKVAGCKMLEYLYEHCTDTVREELASMIIEYGRLSEQNAFLSGYRQAFLLWMEILSFRQEDA